MTTKPKKRGAGRPAFQPSDEHRVTVELMAGIGLAHEQIALAIGIDDKTLRKHFRAELDTGRSRTITRVADSLVRQALAGNVSAAIFYLKTQAGWKETQVNEHTGKDGGPIQHEQVGGDAEAFLRHVQQLAERRDAETKH
jgi:hypothetical protein